MKGVAVVEVGRHLVAVALRIRRGLKMTSRLSVRALAIVVVAQLRQRTKRRHRGRLNKEKDPNEHSGDPLTLFLIVFQQSYLADNCVPSPHAFDSEGALPVREVWSLYCGAV